MFKRSHYLALTGAFLQLFQIVGISIMTVQMNRAVKDMHFEDPNDTGAVVASISKVTHRLGEASHSAMIWGLIALLGMAMFLFAVIKLRYRRVWAFWFAVVCGAATLLSFPVGTIVGLISLSYALFCRREFFEPQRVILVREGAVGIRRPSSRRWSRF
jgi:hypothetical protein